MNASLSTTSWKHWRSGGFLGFADYLASGCAIVNLVGLYLSISILQSVWRRLDDLPKVLWQIGLRWVLRVSTALNAVNQLHAHSHTLQLQLILYWC